MRGEIIKTLLLLSFISPTAFAQQNVAGCYRSNIAELGMFETRIRLNTDSTFYYRVEGDMALRDGKGLYHLKKDTIFLVFDKNLRVPDYGLSSYTIMKEDFNILYDSGKLFDVKVGNVKLADDAGYYLKKFPCDEWKDYQSEVSKLSDY
jgi:hypothetical protein